MYYGRHIAADKKPSKIAEKWEYVFNEFIKRGLTKHPKFAVNIEHKDPKPKGEIIKMATMGEGGP